MRNKTVTRGLAVVAATGLVGLIAASPAGAAGSDKPGGVDVTNTETVQVYMNASGDVQTKRVYEQLALTGHGKVKLHNPISDDGLRNLDGFSGITVKDGKQVIDTTVDGEKKTRSVSDYDGKLPLDVKVRYTLDGKKVAPGDVVGKSGHLVVAFVVENTTGVEQKVSFPDGSGGTTTRTAKVPIPMVGSLSTVAPSSFTNVQSDQANLAGDGKGGTKLSFTMTLFPPIGSTKASFGYSADVKGGVVPRIEISALPVNPLASPTFKTAADSYQGGADTGAKLVDGAVQIDDNLLKLRDGSQDLLAGLLKLSGGADQLDNGLNDTAVPGAKKLADGAGDLSDGLGTLADGTEKVSGGVKKARGGGKKVADGADKLSDGLDSADSGAQHLGDGATQLSDGQKNLAAGIRQLYKGVNGLPATVQAQVKDDPKYKALIAALGSVVNGIGSLSDKYDPEHPTMLGGLNALRAGLRSANCKPEEPDTCGVLDGVQVVKKGIDDQRAGAGLIGPALRAALESAGCQGDPVCKGSLSGIIGPLGQLPDQLDHASDALGQILNHEGDLIGGIDQIRAGLSTGVDPRKCVSDPSKCGAREALLAVKGGVPQLVDAISNNIRDTLLASIGTGGKGCDPTKTLQCGADALVDGGKQLNDGVAALVSGMSQLKTGSSQLSTGAGSLADGLGALDDGASELAAGAGTARDGGLQVADGADKLSNGLGDAADGSSQLADGLHKAADAAPALPEGAQRLSTEGTEQLIGAGQQTTAQYGAMVAVMKAGSERVKAHDMAFGAPKGATGLTAYSYIIKGADGEGSRNAVRGVAGLAVLAAGAGVLALRRRGISL